jgi:hypothetical protein
VGTEINKEKGDEDCKMMWEKGGQCAHEMIERRKSEGGR